jgi:hypothetical protein
MVSTDRRQRASLEVGHACIWLPRHSAFPADTPFATALVKSFLDDLQLEALRDPLLKNRTSE